MPYDVIGDNPIIFFHIPKTAGTTIKKYFDLGKGLHLGARHLYKIYAIDREAPLLEWVPPNPEDLTPTPEVYRRAEMVHVVSEQYFVDREVRGYDRGPQFFPGSFQDPPIDLRFGWDIAFKFTCVRNPWDRAGSIYYHFKEQCGWESFSHYLSDIKNKRGAFEKWGTFMVETDIEPPWYLPYTQTEFLTPLPKSPIELNYLLKQESLGTDIRVLYKLLKEEEAPELDIRERVTDNSKKSYVTLYKDFESVYTIYEYYRDDVRNFGYTFIGAPECLLTQKCEMRYNKENVT